MQFEIWEIIIIAVVLGIDAFSVAVSVAAASCRTSQVIRMSTSFGFFQFFMPLLGWYAGRGIESFIGGYERWIAFGLLFGIGVHMLIESFRHDKGLDCDRTKGWSLLGLSIATSIDALGVGLSLGALRSEIWISAVIIGITAALMTWLGMYTGKKIAEIVGKRIETAGAVVLVLLAFKMLFF